MDENVRRGTPSGPTSVVGVCTVPAIVSTEADGRVKASFVNDRDDVLPVKIVGRRRPAAGSAR